MFTCLFLLQNGSQRHLGQWECVSPLYTSQSWSRFTWNLHTSVCMSSAAPWSGPLNYALHTLCASRHWSFEYSCLVRRLVIRQKDLVKWILWNYSNALCVWNCSSRIFYLEKGTFEYALSLFLNFCFHYLLIFHVFPGHLQIAGLLFCFDMELIFTFHGLVNWWALYPWDQEPGSSY